MPDEGAIVLKASINIFGDESIEVVVGFDEGEEAGVAGLPDLGFGGMAQIADDVLEMFGLDDMLVFFGDDVEDNFGEEEGG